MGTPHLGDSVMKPLKGYWLDPADSPSDATPHLAFEMLGPVLIQPGRSRRCPQCGESLSLLALYRRSPFILLERYAALILEICPKCSRESDGTAGANGFVVRFAGSKALATALRTMKRHLPLGITFRATPTGEPMAKQEFDKWKRGRLHPKLGGRQISIQSESTKRRCSRCGGPWRFVGSIAEKWARRYLNFGFGYGYVFACGRECAPSSASFYWDR